MKKYVLAAITASVLSCSLLLAQDNAVQQAQSAHGGKMNCGKMNCKAVEMKAENAAARFAGKAAKAKAKGDSQLAELCTNCANAQKKIADAAKEAAACMQACKNNKNADMSKQCEQVCKKLKIAQEEAAKANKALNDYKKTNKKTKGSKQTTTSSETPS